MSSIIGTVLLKGLPARQQSPMGVPGNVFRQVQICLRVSRTYIFTVIPLLRHGSLKRLLDLEDIRMDFKVLNEQIAALDKNAMVASKEKWNSLAKPIGSLGLLEDAIIKMAGLTGNVEVNINKRAVLVLCADNGVVAEGVTQAGSDITTLVAGNIAKGCASVCLMASVARADIVAVDMGMIEKSDVKSILDRNIAPGTGNIAHGAAMTCEQALQAIHTGMELVKDYKAKGYKIFATGEMGIGNTTTASAIAAVLLGKPVHEVTGFGAGLSDDGLQHKIDIIEQAIKVNSPKPQDALDVLMKLGGFDIAAMAGIFLGGALYRVNILIDGFISAVSALVAARLCPAAVCAMLASHVSAEPAARMVLNALALPPLINAEMRLGEGTGAVAALPLLDMALAVYHDMSSFSDIGMQAYTPLGGYKCEL